MIESTIRTKLLANAGVSGYTPQVYLVRAPEGAKTPYIVVKCSDQPDESDALGLFDIDIDIYDAREDIRPIRTASKNIKSALHYERLSNSDYENIRLYFQGRTTAHLDQTFMHVNMSFAGRATEFLT